MSKRSNRFNQLAFEEKVEGLLLSLEIPYKRRSSYILAFFRRSVLNELDFPQSNERLEYLGDAVLELITTEYLFHAFPDKDEGAMTDIRSALVRGRNLADIALKLGLSNFILLSKGEIQAGGNLNPYILANTFEALLGAIYLDAGFDAAKRFVEVHVISTLKDILDQALHVDPKSHLQELVQAMYGVTPRYELIAEHGMDHDKTYEIGVYVDSREVGRGMGSSKKKGQSQAAENALARKAEWEK
jgi:ribonuclease III